MDCIFICVFNNEMCIKLLYLLLESIFIYGNLDKDIDILIYTSSHFRSIIMHSHLFNEKIKFEVNDNYNDIGSACKARLDIFSLSSVSNYNKILYLDIDILIKHDIRVIFDLIKDDILYVLEEGNIDHDSDFWGKTLFGDEIHNYIDKTAFTTGILLFKNCPQIKDLFCKIREDTNNRPHFFDCHDQPYIVYNAFKYNLYNNKILKTYAVNNDTNIHSNKVIHHFPGGPGIFTHKLETMTIFLSNLKDNKIVNNINQAKEFINRKLLPIIHSCGELLEGNIFMFNNTTEYTDVFLPKVKNISNMVLNKNIKNVMEIGFNSGFSALLMLLSNPNVVLHCFDLGEHSYTPACYHKLKENFGNRINLTIGDSTKTLLNVNETYDLIHIDGGHSTEVAESDIVNSIRLSKKGTVLIMDDYDFPNLYELWNKYINSYGLNSLDITVYNSPHHDIKFIYKNKNIENKKYSWNEYSIEFLKNNKMNAFGSGYYKYINSHTIMAYFGGREHKIMFSIDYLNFLSVREDDSEQVVGVLIA